MSTFAAMKMFRNIFGGIVWTAVGLYVLSVVLLHVPAVQSRIAGAVAGAVADRLGTEVEIGRVDLGFLNRIIIDDVSVWDKEGGELLHASRLAFKFDYLPLLRNIYSRDAAISLSSARLFGVRCFLRPGDGDRPSNYQFIIDALGGDDAGGASPSVHIGTLVVRRGSVTLSGSAGYSIDNISADLTLPYLTSDSVSLMLRRASCRACRMGEESTPADLRRLSLDVTADRRGAVLRRLDIELPATSVHVSGRASYDYSGEEPDMSTLRYALTVADSRVTPCDLSFADAGLRSFVEPVGLSLSVHGTSSETVVDDFRVYTSSGSADIRLRGMTGDVRDPLQRWSVVVDRADIDVGRLAGQLQASSSGDAGAFSTSLMTAVDAIAPYVPSSVISVTGEGKGEGCDGSLRLTLSGSAGSAEVSADVAGTRFAGTLHTDGLDIGSLSGDARMGIIAGDLSVSGVRQPSRSVFGGWGALTQTDIECRVPRIDYNGYAFGDISVTASARTAGGMTAIDVSSRMDDRHGCLVLTAEGLMPRGGRVPLSFSSTLEMSRFSPQAMRLLSTRGDSIYVIDHATVSAAYADSVLTVSIDDSTVEGTLTVGPSYAGRPQRHGLPALLARLPVVGRLADSDITARVILRSGEHLQGLWGIALETPQPAVLDISTGGGTADMLLTAPCIIYDGTRYEDTRADVAGSTDDGLTASLFTRRTDDDGRHMDLGVTARNRGDSLYAEIGWDNGPSSGGRHMQGTLRGTALFPGGMSDLSSFGVTVHPSEILVNDSTWTVSRSSIGYGGGRLTVDNFSIRSGDRYITVDGCADAGVSDSLVVGLRRVDIAYILDLVNFRAVRFSGQADGRLYARSVFGPSPEFYGDIEVADFCFQDGYMGVLQASLRRDASDGRIDITATTRDGDDRRTVIEGYVSPAANYMDLAIEPRGASCAFLESFCAFMRDVDVQAWGRLRVYGDLRDVNLTGRATATGSIGIRPLNTTYHLDGDTITLIPDEIIFSNDTVTDDYGNMAIVNGALHHRHLTRLTYDIDIAAHDVLAFDRRDYGDDTFRGTVFATGTCSIRGRRGTIDIDIDATPARGSIIEYNAAGSSSPAEQDYITWRDGGSRPVTAAATVEEPSPAATSFASDMRINFIINATPDFTLRVLMDEGGGDYITLRGTGALKASYYNKGSFGMFGTYAVSDGEYKLTIQNIMTRIFAFQPGSTIVFGGDPYDASLALKAMYTVNSVPLSDLHIGNSFSGNNVRVDCLMNIGGTPYSPSVEFDMDLPTVSSDANSMVRSLINSEEEMNQQVIYLLTIGRFYVQDASDYGDDTKADQTSLAMQSLLSGTLSRQINSMLSSFVNISNWNVGANISTGDEGWNNAEYEGLVSGRLLDNRLLVNGQFGYRDNANATTSFIGDFDVQYLLTPNGNYSLKVYNRTNDRYFTKSSLNTQGIGLIINKDFNTWKELFR